MLPNKHLIIAIDFDGTIVEDAYPKLVNLYFSHLKLSKNFNLKGID